MPGATPLPRRSILAALPGAALAVAGLSACSSAGAREPVKFHLSKPEAIPYFRDLIDRFNSSHPDIEVIFDTSSNLQAGFLRGNPPDLGLLNYNMEMARFMERGALSDLADLPEAGRILPDVQALVDQYATYPGRTSVLPYSVMAASVIYNTADLRRQRRRGAAHLGCPPRGLRHLQGRGGHAVLRHLQGPVDGWPGVVRLLRRGDGRRRRLLRPSRRRRGRRRARLPRLVLQGLRRAGHAHADARRHLHERGCREPGLRGRQPRVRPG